MKPILLSSFEANEQYAYTFESIGYIAYLVQGEGANLSWREGIAIPHENQDFNLTDQWRVQLFREGDVAFVSSPIRLGEALTILTDWTTAALIEDDFSSLPLS